MPPTNRLAARLGGAALVLIASAATGCDGRTPAEHPGTTAPIAAASTTITPAPTGDALAAYPLVQQRLAFEAGSRPAARVRAEEVYAALSAVGLAPKEWRQVVARSMGARFCMRGTTEGASVVVCEFNDEAAATSGIAQVRARFGPLMPGRRFARRGNTVVMVTPVDPSGAADRDLARVLEIFTTL